MYSTEPEQQPMAIVNLQMEDQNAEIRVYEGDDVEVVVELFCQQYGLGQDCVQYLVDQINQQLRREPSPRFGDSFGSNFIQRSPLQPSQSKQSDFGLTTQASSVDENQNSAQKSYEQWQQVLNKKTDLKLLLNQPQNTVQWSVPNSARSFNDNKKISINERLYREGVDLQKQKIEKAEMHKLQRTQLEQKNATFKPLISPRSRQIAQQKQLSKPDNSISDIGSKLYQKGLDLNVKKQQQRNQYQEQQRKLSPFQPNGLDTSRNNSQHRSNTPIYEKLFQQAKEDKKKKEEFVKQEFNKKHPFHPQTQNPRLKTDAAYQQKQVQKLFKESEEKSIRMEKKKHQLSMLNQPTFQPKITKDSTFMKVSKKKNYEDSMLANDLLKIQQRLGSKNSCSSSETRIQSQQSTPTQISQFDINITRIFKQLDGDKDGYVSKDKLNLSGIDIEMLELISEALYQIDDENIVVDQVQFKKICQSFGLESKLSKF